MTQELLTDLQRCEPVRQVETQIAPNVLVSADTTLMRVVLENLLNNAWKFTRHHPTAQIEFGMTDASDSTIYFVRDDGVGFDMSKTKDTFGFQGD